MSKKSPAVAENCGSSKKEKGATKEGDCLKTQNVKLKVEDDSKIMDNIGTQSQNICQNIHGNVREVETEGGAKTVFGQSGGGYKQVIFEDHACDSNYPFHTFPIVEVEYNGKILMYDTEDGYKVEWMNYYLSKCDFYYIDKTGMIKELLENGGEVNLFTRPRRFGKSLNMSMLKYFFEIGADSALFDGLAISRERELCDEHFGKYPVIAVSLKTAHGRNFEQAKNVLCTIIGKEAKRFQFLLDSDRIDENDREMYRQLINVDSSGRGIFDISDEALASSLNTLLDAGCDEQFGFTDIEVRAMLEYYGLMEYYELTKTWYDGYMVSDTNVYNPWDVINWCDQLLTNPNKVPKSYWTNTSSNTERGADRQSRA